MSIAQRNLDLPANNCCLLGVYTRVCSFRGDLVETIATPVSVTVQYTSTLYRDYGGSHLFTRLYQPENSLIITS